MSGLRVYGAELKVVEKVLRVETKAMYEMMFACRQFFFSRVTISKLYQLDDI